MDEKKPEGKSEVLHIHKFMDGKATPQEVHRAFGIRKRCAICGQPAAIRIKVLAQYSELVKHNPEYVAAIAASNPDGPMVPTIPTKYGPMVKIRDIGACDRCKAEAEKAASKHPSWCIIEIDRGPDPNNRVAAQVPATP